MAKRRRRGNGEGTVYQRGDGRWCGQWTRSVCPITGKQDRVTVYGDTATEVREKLKKSQEAPRSGTQMSLKVAAELWLAEEKSQVSPRSVQRYRSDLDPIVKKLSTLPIRDISPILISNILREMEEEKVSRSKQSRCISRLRQMFRRLVNIGFLLTNAAEKVPIPRHEKAAIRPMTAEQARQLLVAAEGHPYEALYWLALDSGARLRELLALTPADIDLEAGEVYIQHSLTVKDGEVVRKSAKTAKGRRRVALTSQSIEK